MGIKSRCALRSAVIQFIEQLESRTLLAADGYGYTAASHAVEALHLAPGDQGVTNLLSNADDDTASVDLGSNTFNFYGKTYTGDGQLFASSNGLLTFETGDTTYANADLSTGLPERAIAPLWDDWIGIDNLPGQVLAKLDDTGGSSAPDRLIIQWNADHYSSTPSPVLFQAILQLNTGATPGNITFNYVNIDTGDPETAEGVSATVGIKDIGVQGPNQMLISENDANALIGDGQAILISDTVTGQPHADAGAPQTVDEGTPAILDASASTDPNQSAASLTYAWDLDGNGIFGETGADAVNGDEIGIHPSFSPAAGTGTFPITLRVTNNAGFTSFDTSSVTVAPVAPTVTLTPPAHIFAGVPADFTIAASPSNHTYNFSIDYGDGSTEFPTGGDTQVTDTHVFTAPGTYSVSALASDENFTFGSSPVVQITVQPRPDALLTSQGILLVTTTTGNSVISIDQTGSTLNLHRNGVLTTYNFSDVAIIDIQTGDGNDTITANVNIFQEISSGAGNDTITTGDADDTINAGDGKDSIASNAGDDSIIGNLGDKTIDAGKGKAFINISGGNNHIVAEAGDITTGGGNDTILGGDGGLNITTGVGIDSITTGAGNDTINDLDDGGTQFISTGAGDDFIDTTSADLANLGTINSGDGNDTILAASELSISAGAGNDSIAANLVTGSVDCGSGNDFARIASTADHPAIVFGGDGNDTIFTTDGPDSIYGGAGRDKIYAGNGSDLISGGGGNDQLFGQGGRDRIYGGAGNDRLEGLGGDDRLFGGPGADHIDGGGGTNAAPHDDPLDQLINIQNDLT